MDAIRAGTALAEHHCLFATAIGPCGIAWSERGVTRVQLPEADRSATERRLLRGATAKSAGDRPPLQVQATIDRLTRHVAGEEIDFGPVVLDLTGITAFHRKVYEAARRVGWGRTATYGELAGMAGSPGAARAVGQALGRNPVPIIVPCHRILASGGRVAGFSAFGGATTKARLLALEGVRPGGEQALHSGLR